MDNILSSASKIVFILMAVAVIALTFLKIVEAKDFMMLAAMAFTFYFSYKGQSGEVSATTTMVEKTPPYAGK